MFVVGGAVCCPPLQKLEETRIGIEFQVGPGEAGSDLAVAALSVMKHSTAASPPSQAQIYRQLG